MDIVVYENVNTGARAFGLDGSGVAFTAQGAAVPVSLVWAEVDGAEVDEVPEPARAPLLERIERMIVATTERAALKAADEAARRAYEASKAYRDDQAFIKAMNRLTKSIRELTGIRF